jgi:hypothetical protein
MATYKKANPLKKGEVRVTKAKKKAKKRAYGMDAPARRRAKKAGV